ncbi:MAG TPA: DUF885 family protein [Acidimicrobiia bacterium]|nr:DUF885 family protein [Acidimicrobiia bacterium]
MALFDQLVDRVSAALWNLHPSAAVRLGKHEYDGQVPDLSAEALAAGYDRLGRLRGQVTALTGLAPDQELDRAVLLAALDAELLAGQVAECWRWDPGCYLKVLVVDAYLGRDYAPAGLRLEKAAMVLQSAPEVLAAARANLRLVIPRPAAERGAEQARVMAARLAGGPTPAGETADQAEKQWLVAAAGEAAAALQAFAGWLEVERLPAAGEDFALGEEVVEQMLRAGEMVERSLDEAAGLGRAALAADRAALAKEEEAEEGEAAVSPPGGWAGAVAAAVEEAGRFVAGAGLATLPDPPPLVVAECPGPSPEEAWLVPPGPYDDPASGAVLWAWGLENGWGLGAPDELAVAAAYPGRLLQALRAAGAPTEAARRFAFRSFAEGWALYAGEAMWEAGHRGAGPAWRRVWLRRALRADCHLVCVPALHRGQMSVEQAEVLFMEQGKCERAAARREADRAAVDPGCLSAALGRLEILDLRRRWRERHPGVPLGAFHDALLSRGAPPLGLLERVVLP